MTAGTGGTVNTTICTQTAVDGGVGEAGSD